MIPIFTLLFLLAAPAPLTLDQVKADPNPEHRAKAAIDYASYAERNAETAYSKGEMQSVDSELKNVQESIEAADEALVASHKTPGRNPGPYKYAELRSRELLIRLGDLEQKMDTTERTLISAVKSRVQEIHDAWFEGIMGRKR
jgi:hypothetical protein